MYPSWKTNLLAAPQALRVPVILLGACGSRFAASRTVPVDATALTPVQCVSIYLLLEGCMLANSHIPFGCAVLTLLDNGSCQDSRRQGRSK